jgi:hypothetical protein
MYQVWSKSIDSRVFTRMGQGHRVKFLGEGIRHALRCPCFLLLLIQIFINIRSELTPG